ncbi:hypothetical protein B0H14DRAFT_3735661 [Mycena olivaceomarginata]|nr:hypothetical protein B0H14DRAFT_3735661 [Mycena olivaceomarginata]
MPLHAHHLTFAILLFLVPPSLAVIDITTCQQAIATALLQDPSLTDNTTIFYQTPTSAQNGSLTLFGCEVYCVPGQPRLKSDCGNRLFQWFLPGLLLIVSIATPPVEWWYQVWTSVRPVADPFDAILSVSHRLSVAERCHRDANELVDAWREEGESGPKWDTQRIEQSNPRLQISIALLLYTLPIIAPHLGPKRILSAVLSSSLLNKTQLTSLIHRTAGRLAEDRTRGVAGAWFISL